MLKFIIVILMSLVITKSLNIFFGGSEDATQHVYKITPQSGAVGCLTKKKYYEAAGYYEKHDMASLRRLMAESICFIFKYGEEVRAPQGTCQKGENDNDLYQFKSPRFKMIEPFLPCFAVR